MIRLFHVCPVFSKKCQTLCLLLGLLLGRAAPTVAKTHEGAIYFSTSGTQDAQVKSILIKVIETLDGVFEGDLQPRFYPNYQQFSQALKEGRPVLAYTNLDFEHTPPKYQRFVSTSVYGSSKVTDCLYVRNAAYQKVSDLKGATALTYPYEPAYYSLRRLVGFPPESFFKLGAVTSGLSSFIALSLDQAQVVHSTDTAFKHMKKTNPGPVKNVRALVCSPQARPYPAVLARKDTNPQVLEKTREIMMGVGKNPLFKQFWPLMRLTQFSFADTRGDGYESLIRLRQKALKAGWQKDFEGWLKVIGKSKME